MGGSRAGTGGLVATKTVLEKNFLFFFFVCCILVMYRRDGYALEEVVCC